jgi:sugar phosphate isomerase/epimerase
MANKKSNARRNFLKTATLSTAGLALTGVASVSGSHANAKVTGTGMPSGANNPATASARRSSDKLLKLAVATYSLRHFDRAKTIEMTQQIGADYVNVKSFHAPKDYSPTQLQAARREFEQAGLKIGGGGVVNLRDGDEDFFRSRFEYGSFLGFEVMIVNVNVADLPRLEKFAVEYDMKVAIHNHSSSGATFPSPQAIMEHIGDLDPRVGICNDLGHTALNGVDVIESIDACKGRMYDIHLKDMKDLTDSDTQCAIGDGSMPVAQIFHKLAEIRYPYMVGLEYEIEHEDPLVGMIRSFAYMRGVKNGLRELLVV